MVDTIAVEQRKTKPELEDMTSTLEDTARGNVLAFLDYCREKKIKYPWSSTNRWVLKAKGKVLGYIGIGKRAFNDYSWYVMPDLHEILQYDDFIQKEGLTEVIWNHVKHCDNCFNCVESHTATILGREFHNVCGTAVRFKNPDIETIEIIKKMLDFRLSIRHGTATRPIYDHLTDGLTRIDNRLHVIEVSDLQGNPFPGRPNEKIDYLFDSKYSSYARFQTDEHSYDVVFQMDDPIELTTYSLVTGFLLDVPDSWKLYGAASKNGPWTLLDMRDEFPRPVTNYTEKTFKIHEPGVYRFYRFTFEGRKFVLSQVHLYIQ